MTTPPRTSATGASLAPGHLEAVLSASVDAVITVDTAGLVTSWNHAAEALYGYRAEEIIGRPPTVLWPDDPVHQARANEIRQSLLRGEKVAPFEGERVSKDGRTLFIRQTMQPVWNEEGQVVGAVAVVRDLSERKRTDAVVQELVSSAHHRTVVIEAANRVALEILSSRTGVEALRHIADAARLLAGARYAALGVAALNGDGLQEFITVGISPQEQRAIGPLPRGRGILGLLLQRSEPLRIDVLAHHPASVGFPANHPPMDSFLGVPIRRGNTVLGSLYLTNKRGAANFTEADEIAVQALGAHAAVAIHNLHMVSRHRALLRGLLTAQEEERRSIAFDLHDGLTQYVMASHAHLEAFQSAQAAHQQERAARELTTGMDYLKEAVVESRRMVTGLRALALDDLGLVGALEQLIHDEKVRAGWDSVNFTHTVSHRRFDSSIETTAYRIVQEALTNARKHARAKSIVIVLRDREGDGTSQLLLDVRDDGTGFDTVNNPPEPNHFGMQGMMERALLAGGTCIVRSAPGEGTVVTATFPLPEPAPATHETETHETETHEGRTSEAEAPEAASGPERPDMGANHE